MATNIFTRAKQLQKQHPNKSWKDLVKMAGTKKSVSQTKNTSNMATKKRRSTGKTKAVGAVRTVTRTRTVKAKTQRRNVGAIIDKNMVGVAVGMALTGVAQGMIEPLKARVPANMRKLVDPALAIAGYAVSQRAKNPILRGVGLGIMAEGVKNTTQLVMGVVKPAAPVITAPAGGPGMPPGNMSNMGATYYMPLPSMGRTMGEIPDVIAGINLNSDNKYATLPDMGYANVNEPYLPLGWDA